MKYTQTYEEYKKPRIDPRFLSSNKLQKNEFIVLSLSDSLFLVRLMDRPLLSTTPNFIWSHCEIFRPYNRRYKYSEVYYNVKTDKYYHAAGVELNDPKFEYNILWRGFNRDEAEENYNMISSAKNYNL